MKRFNHPYLSILRLSINWPFFLFPPPHCCSLTSVICGPCNSSMVYLAFEINQLLGTGWPQTGRMASCRMGMLFCSLFRASSLHWHWNICHSLINFEFSHEFFSPTIIVQIEHCSCNMLPSQVDNVETCRNTMFFKIFCIYYSSCE